MFFCVYLLQSFANPVFPFIFVSERKLNASKLFKNNLKLKLRKMPKSKQVNAVKASQEKVLVALDKLTKIEELAKALQKQIDLSLAPQNQWD